jgi:hypothetical protein
MEFKSTDLLKMNLTDFLNEVKQDLKCLKYQLQLADMCVISDIDMVCFLQRLTDNFDLKKLQTVYNDIQTWKFYVLGRDTLEPYNITQIRKKIIAEGYNHAYDETYMKLKKAPFFTDSYIEDLEKVEDLRGDDLNYCPNPLINRIIDGYYDAISDYQRETGLFDGLINDVFTETEQTELFDKLDGKHSFTHVFTETEYEQLFDGLIKDGFLFKDTKPSHFCYVFGGVDIPDDEKPFKPLVWQKSVGLLAYMIDSLFSDTDHTNLWEITVLCFIIKGKAPNKNTMKNTVSKYKNDYKEKPKGYKALDAIIKL